MVFQATVPGPRTVHVTIVENRSGNFRWDTGKTHALKWFKESIDAQRDAVSTYGRDIQITDENGGVRYVP